MSKKHGNDQTQKCYDLMIWDCLQHRYKYNKIDTVYNMIHDIYIYIQYTFTLQHMHYSRIFIRGSHGICHIHIDRHLLFKCCLGKQDLKMFSEVQVSLKLQGDNKN